MHTTCRPTKLQANMAYTSEPARNTEIEDLTKQVKNIMGATQAILQNQKETVEKLQISRGRDPHNVRPGSSNNNNQQQTHQPNYASGAIPRYNYNNRDNNNRQRGYNTPNQIQRYENNNNDGNYKGRGNFSQNNIDTCPEPPNRNNTYGLCAAHIRFGARSYRCYGNCRWEQFRIPHHRCTLRYCRWERFLPTKQNMSNNWRDRNNDGKN